MEGSITARTLDYFGVLVAASACQPTRTGSSCSRLQIEPPDGLAG
jgi:hypothetical protein